MESGVWFALTLSLSPRRGNSQSPRWGKSLNGERCPELKKLLPLLGGEGRGEGERFISLHGPGQGEPVPRRGSGLKPALRGAAFTPRQHGQRNGALAENTFRKTRLHKLIEK
ncbi:MAG: hypothetical protein DME23_03430 [Verrucomicrobia bacterium]|nr:MAG: hypothetical protein DME23_03430 [Verrucomicrobiota bacterium]